MYFYSVGNNKLNNFKLRNFDSDKPCTLLTNIPGP